ncbi:hypothetical protein [Litchfieldella rifensis]|uniref:Gliding motility-associated protein GldM N-terminal domain-containing protein n=1 Tax=Litchfieldella rifensis TaxID=762643 RepID=A0ABV7LJG3_9GAMM
MLNFFIMFLGVVGVCTQIATRKSSEYEKPLTLVGLHYGAMIGIILLSGYSQYSASQSDESYRKASLEIEVLSEASEHFIPVVKSMNELQSKMLTVKSYLSYQSAQDRHPELAEAIDWYKDSSDSHQAELQSAQHSLDRIQSAAAEIIKLNIAHGSLIPLETVEWASETLSIEFSNVESYFDAYAPVGETPKSSVLGYVDRTGKAFGLIMGRLRSATSVLSDDGGI